MGYTHQWYRRETPDGPLPPEPRDAYGHLAFDTLTIIAAASQRGIALADWSGTPGSRPEVDEGGIGLNGVRPYECASFVWPAQPGEPWWTNLPGKRWLDFCTTNRQPYDLVVCAVLIRVAFHYRASVRIASDGGWDGSELDGRWYPEWTPARRLVVELFGPDADRNPLEQR